MMLKTVLHGEFAAKPGLFASEVSWVPGGQSYFSTPLEQMDENDDDELDM